MIVVADASPINHLVRIGQIEILAALFGEVMVPPEVAAELAHPHAPAAVRGFASAPPAWLCVRAPNAPKPLPQLGAGEAAAINLARQENAALLLMDDRDGRQVASSREWQIPITGTLGVLERAAERGLLDLRDALRSLISTKFRLDTALVEAALRRDLERKLRER